MGMKLINNPGNPFTYNGNLVSVAPDVIGIYSNLGPGSYQEITNSGTIKLTSGDHHDVGIKIVYGGTITNTASGYISAYEAILIANSSPGVVIGVGALFNYGTIKGTRIDGNLSVTNGSSANTTASISAWVQASLGVTNFARMTAGASSSNGNVVCWNRGASRRKIPIYKPIAASSTASYTSLLAFQPTGT